MKQSPTRRLQLSSADITRLRAFARVEMGMSPAEFDVLTPAEWQRHFRAWEHREDRLDLRMARVCYYVLLSSGRAKKGTVMADFMPNPAKWKKLRSRIQRRFKQTPTKQLLKEFLLTLPKAKTKHGK